MIDLQFLGLIAFYASIGLLSLDWKIDGYDKTCALDVGRSGLVKSSCIFLLPDWYLSISEWYLSIYLSAMLAHAANSRPAVERELISRDGSNAISR